MDRNIKKITIVILAIITASILIDLSIIKLIIGVLLFYFLMKKDKKIEENNEDEILEINDTTSHDQIRMQYELIREKDEERKKFMQEADVRQFEGRKDVTIDEVSEYLINRTQFIGFEKRQCIMKRITQVCNMTEKDMNEVFHQIWGKVKIQEDNEGQRIRDWEIEKGKQEELKRTGFWSEFKEQNRKYYKTDEEWEKMFPKEKIDELDEKEFQKKETIYKFYDYDNWLKKKGYTNE